MLICCYIRLCHCTCPVRSGVYSANIMCRINLISAGQLQVCNNLRHFTKSMLTGGSEKKKKRGKKVHGRGKKKDPMVDLSV